MKYCNAVLTFSEIGIQYLLFEHSLFFAVLKFSVFKVYPA